MGKTFFRIVIAVGAYLFIAVKISSSGFSKISEVIANSFTTPNILLLILVLALMPVVWALEALKWKRSLKQFTDISFGQSWRSVWYGVVAGQITPNRIGEPIGRLALIDPEVRGRGGVAAVWCSFSQQSMTVLFGFISIAWWLFGAGLTVFPEKVPLWFINVIILAWVVVLVIAIFRIDRIALWLERFSWVKKTLHGEKLIIGYNPATIAVVFAISALRYAVFSSQYVILLKVFGVNANVLDLYAAVGLTYLFSSFIPSFSASEVGIRAGFAVWFVGMLYNNPAGVTAASLLLWLLNIAAPAMIAAWFPWKTVKEKTSKLLGSRSNKRK